MSAPKLARCLYNLLTVQAPAQLYKMSLSSSFRSLSPFILTTTTTARLMTSLHSLVDDFNNELPALDHKDEFPSSA